MLLTLAVGCWALLSRYLPDSTKRTIELARVTLPDNPSEAERLLRGLLAAEGDDPRALSLLTKSLARQQRWEESLEFAEHWAESAPDDPEAWETIARLRLTQGKIIPATIALRQAIRYSGDSTRRSDLRHELIGLLIQAEDAAGARREVQLLELDSPGQRLPLIQEAYLLRLEGRPGEALAVVERAIGRQPDSIAAIMLRGVIQLDLRQYGPAAADLSRVLESDPNNKEAHYKLALALRSLGEMEKAEHHFEISRRLVDHSERIVSLQWQIGADPDNETLRQRLREALQANRRLTEE